MTVITERLARLRREMAQRGMDGYVVVTDDFHGSEYVGDFFKARAYLSGFTGSAGTLVVLPDRAALWTDGRYFLQAAEQLTGSTIELMRMGQPGVPAIGAFLAQHLPEGGVLGFQLPQLPLQAGTPIALTCQSVGIGLQLPLQLREPGLGLLPFPLQAFPLALGMGGGLL